MITRAGDSDDPAGAAEADGRGERGEQQHLGDQPGHRAGLNRSHRSSAPMYVGQYVTAGIGTVADAAVAMVRVGRP